jgi:solute carrier family 25 iron transporter 28/37
MNGQVSRASNNFLLKNTIFVQHSQSMATLTRASGLTDAVKIIYRTEGYRGFFKGIVPRTIFQVPGTAVSWSVYEYFKHRLKLKHQSDH